MDNTKIEWTDHTFNPWHGCMKVSEGCKNCYAEVMDKRWNGSHWGPRSPRKAMSEAYWQKPMNWDRAAKQGGEQAKVFCASMADVFEGHPDTIPHLQRLFALIENTPHLIWQLLTKRPENIMELVPDYWKGHFPANVWIGTSVENQDAADKRIPLLLRVPASVRFLSCEPLLGPIDLSLIKVPNYGMPVHIINCVSGLAQSRTFDDHGSSSGRPIMETDCFGKIDWVIAGGESGHHARPAHPDWIRSLRDQCQYADVPFFFKQWGEYILSYDAGERADKEGRYNNTIGECWVKFSHQFTDGINMVRVGKKAAGRLLDGKEHNEFP